MLTETNALPFRQTVSCKLLPKTKDSFY